MIRNSLILALCVIALPAAAVEIDFSRSLTYHGAPIPSCEPPKDAAPDVVKRCALPLTLGAVVSQALDAPDQPQSQSQGMGGRDLTTTTPDEKFRRGMLANKVWGAEKLDVSPEDQVLMKNAVGKGWSPAIIAVAWPMIDPSVLSKKP